jgi:hypothetical protein
MLKIIEGKIWHDTEKVGWVDGSHIRSEATGEKLGYVQDPFIFNEAGHKVGYVHENQLICMNGQQAPISLEHINGAVAGTYPLLMKCAVYLLLEE